MSDFQFNCSSCGQSLEAPADMVGQLIDCPSCGDTVEVAKQNPNVPRTSPSQRFVPRKAAPARHPVPMPPPNKENPNIPAFKMEGVGETLVVYSDKLEITPKGVLGFMAKGLKGTKTIPFHSIVAIQFKESGSWSGSGYLQFTIPGGNESRGGLFNAAIDENTFMFAGQNDLAAKIKAYIETRIRELRNPAPQQTAPSENISTELERLATLFRQGVLSEDEFKQAKARLLG